MSARQVRKTVRALLKDAVLGLKPTITDLAIADPVDSPIATDFNYVRGQLTGKMLPTGQPNITVDARNWRPEQKVVKPQRDSRVLVEIRGEFSSADPDQLEDQRDLTVIALVKCLDGLREYSDANGGTILDVEDPYNIDIGLFGGPITTEGFICNFTVLERSIV
jgi:hypothetical protein